MALTRSSIVRGHGCIIWNPGASQVIIPCAGGIDADLAVGTVTAGAPGSINLSDVDAITLASVVSTGGGVSVTAGGTMTATSVSAVAGDVSLATTAGDVAVGAVVASLRMRLEHATRVMPLGIGMGLLVILLNFIDNVWVAAPFLVLLGALGGFLVVPMNALLQHRGHVLMSAGHSIAVQNFNENLNILLMLGIYSLLLRLDFHVNLVIVMFGLLIAALMLCVIVLHRANQRRFDSVSLIGEQRH
jgi:hypothetical protein